MDKVKTFRFEGEDTRYAVSEYGVISNLKTDRKLKPYVDNAGYLTVNVSVKSQVLKLKIHLIVNELYNKPRPDGFVVNHIDHNKLNNHYTNLEVISYSENTRKWHVHRKGQFTESELLSLEDYEISKLIIKEEVE